METEQAQKWANEFGNEYINRNPKNIQDLDNLYIKNFGITRTSLNKEFLLDLPRDIKVLEVGCNVGAQLIGLQELGFEDLTGIEISKKAIEQAKQNTKNINFLNASALNLPFKDNSFDLVFTAGVLIHIHPGDLNKVIDEIYRTSKNYILGWEYFSEECQEIEYRGNKNMLWKNNFMQLFLDRYQDLKIIKQKKVKYLDSKNQDHMFLLEKSNNMNKDYIEGKIKFCKKCLMPNTRPGSIFNKERVCQACLNYENRKFVDWKQREKELKELCDKYRRNDGDYDCIIAVSGGKDSYFLVHTLVKKMDMHPLLITVTDSFTHTNAGIHNKRNLIETFKLNHYEYTINHDLFKRATKIAFEETGEALKFVEYAIYTIPTLLAQKFNIPFVIYGENSAYEYGNTDKDFYLANPIIQKMSDKLEEDKSWWVEKGLREEEVSSIQLDKMKKLPEVIYLSYFYPWSSLKNLKIAKKYGFMDLSHEWKREGCVEDFEQIDSIAYMVHLWLKYPKFGFQRTFDIVSRRIREKKITIEEAKKLIREKDQKLDQKALKDFITFLGYSPIDFWDIVEKFWNKEIFEKVNDAWQMKKEFTEQFN